MDEILLREPEDGVFPFAHVIGICPTGKVNFLIMRRDYEQWSKEYLNV